MSRNAPKGTKARCRHCGHAITAVRPVGPGRWEDADGAHCEDAKLGMHQP